MEISSLKTASEELIDVNLVPADEEGNGACGFKVCGVNSETYQSATREWQLASVRRNAKRGNIKAYTEEGAATLIDTVKQREEKLCMSCIKGVYGFTDNGAAAECTPVVIAKIFAAMPAWRVKVLSVIEGETGFTKA